MAEQPEQASILIVDDDDMHRNLLNKRLRLAGFRNVTSVETGQQALDTLAYEMPDLILLDVMMPGMDGYEVTRYIRSAYPSHNVPIILISALRTAEDRTQGIAAGANDFITKPFNTEELLARIHSQLATKQARDALQTERERMALLYDMSRSLASQLDYSSLLHQIASLTSSLTGAAKTLLIALDETGSFQERIVARQGEAVYTTDTIDPQILNEGLVGWVLKHRQAVIIPDVAEDPRWARQPDRELDTRSAAAVPLIRSDVVGVLLMTSPEPDAFQMEHLHLLMAIGGQAAIALENARLFQTAREQRARAEALLNQTGDPVLVVDSSGLIDRINPSAERILNLTDEALGRPLADVFSLRLADLLLRAEERQSPVSGEYTLRGESITQARTFNVSVSPVEELGFVLLWQDITAIKEAERVRLESERAETQRVLEALSRYMSPALVERVLGDPDILTRRERREALVLFADLRGFTRLTIEHSPDEVIKLLNDVFAEMMEIVYQHEGVIFDIAGDELMIAFNVPYSQPDARHRALVTAITMQRRFSELKARWAARGMKVGMGIGINAGQVVLGHVGGRSRMNYAMVGQAVNLAHRLVEVAEDGQIVVAPGALPDDLPEVDGLLVSELPLRQVKGADRPQEMVLIEVR